jgi:hypothetical protein
MALVVGLVDPMSVAAVMVPRTMNLALRAAMALAANVVLASVVVSRKMAPARVVLADRVAISVLRQDLADLRR